MRNFIGYFGLIMMLGACAGSARYEYLKEGVSTHQTKNAQSECEYQIRLNKTPTAEQSGLLKLCMQGKGFRLKRVK